MALRLFVFLLALVLPGTMPLLAADDGPLISITSPDQGTTFAYGSIKNHSLLWSKRAQCLLVRVTFTDAQQNFGQPQEDTQQFRLPGITFDAAKGIYYATSPKGVVVPVARNRKTLFITTIEAMPNAAVRIQRLKGNVTVVLEAISPDDPAMRPAPTDPDGTTKVDVNKIMN